MPEQYNVERRNMEQGIDTILIHDLLNRYTLEIKDSDITQKMSPNDPYLAYVMPYADYEKVRLIRWNSNIPITGRSLGEYFMNMTIGELDYPSSVAKRLADTYSGKSIIEIGPGLGEFLPYVANMSPHILPIGVDSADYLAIGNLLKYAIINRISEKRQPLMEEMLRRARIITNPQKVKLFNITFEQFMEENPGIQGTIDLLIDNSGISVSPATRLSGKYSTEGTGQGNRVKLLNDYLKLLKRGGIMAIGKSDVGFVEIQKPL